MSDYSEYKEFVEDLDRVIWRIDYNYYDGYGKPFAGIYESVGLHEIDKTGFPKRCLVYDGECWVEPERTIPFNGTIEEYLIKKGRQDIIESNKRFIKELEEMQKELQRRFNKEKP